MPFIAHRVYQWEPVVIDASWGLQTIPNGIAYPLCNSMLCRRCGLVFLDIRFSESEMARLYHNYRDESYAALRERYEPGYIQRNSGILHGVSYLREVESFLKPFLPEVVRVLDWGGDTGVNTPFKDSAANTIHIYDISNIETAEKIRKVSRETAAHHEYDLVVCSNVLEHVSYPRQALLQIMESMSLKTVLYLEVPLENLVKAYADPAHVLANKRHWHEHINFFSRASLEALIDGVGLSLVDFRELDIQSEGRPYTQFQLACVRSGT